MQRGKNMQYAMAGVQLAPGIRMNVKSHVRVPDAEAGYESDRTPYYAAETRPATARRAATISCTAGVVFLFVVFAAVGLLVVGRAARRAELSKSISAMESSISQTLSYRWDCSSTLKEYLFPCASIPEIRTSSYAPHPLRKR